MNKKAMQERIRLLQHLTETEANHGYMFCGDFNFQMTHQVNQNEALRILVLAKQGPDFIDGMKPDEVKKIRKVCEGIINVLQHIPVGNNPEELKFNLQPFFDTPFGEAVLKVWAWTNSDEFLTIQDVAYICNVNVGAVKQAVYSQKVTSIRNWKDGKEKRLVLYSSASERWEK